MSIEKVKVASPQINQNDVDAVVDALWSGRLTSGPKVREFEEKFAQYCGTKHAVAVNSGTAALHASLVGLGIEAGDEVVVPSLTFFSTVTSVIHQGCIPIFCDISPANFCLDPDSFKAQINDRTKAVIPVHYFGHAAEMEKIRAISLEYGIKVIEDCAQAHGTLYYDKIVGSIGDCGAFSMFATKHMTTCEGGMVTTDDDGAAEIMRSFRSHGMEGRNDHIRLGYNYRMPEPLGALGIAQLARLDELNDKRIRNSEKLINMIKDIDWLTVPEVPDYVKHTYFWCHVRIDEGKLGMSTSELISKLGEKGVEVRHRYIEPLYKQPLMTTRIPRILKLTAGENLPDYSTLSFPNAEAIVGQVIGLPNRPDIKDNELEYVNDVLRSF